MYPSKQKCTWIYMSFMTLVKLSLFTEKFHKTIKIIQKFIYKSIMLSKKCTGINNINFKLPFQNFLSYDQPQLKPIGFVIAWYFCFKFMRIDYKNRIIFGTPGACTIYCGFKSEAESGKHRDVIVVMYFFLKWPTEQETGSLIVTCVLWEMNNSYDKCIKNINKDKCSGSLSWQHIPFRKSMFAFFLNQETQPEPWEEMK